MPPHPRRSLVAALCTLSVVAASAFVLGRLSAGPAPLRTSAATPTVRAEPTVPDSVSTTLPSPPARSPLDRAYPLPGVGAGTADRAGFSPYADTSLVDSRPLAETAREKGIREFTLAFVVADESGDGCAPSWGGSDLRENPVAAQIGDVRAAGADVRVSFGGADGVELASACTDESGLADAYREVVDTYRLTKVDFDVEGSELGETAANDRRARVIARLQREAAEAGRTLDVSLTLPVMPEGLTEEGTRLLEGAVAAGVRISGVNIMTMNYGPEYRGDMAEYARQAAEAVHTRLTGLLGLTDAEAWRVLGVTPMIGVNDVTAEVFDVGDAEELLEFARAKGIGRISMWSVVRDGPCPDGRQPRAVATCSSIDQEEGDFLRVFAAYEGPRKPLAD